MGNSQSIDDFDDFRRNKRNVDFHLVEYEKLLNNKEFFLESEEEAKRQLCILKKKLEDEIKSLDIITNRELNEGKITETDKMTKLSIIKELQNQFDIFDPQYKEIIERGLKITDEQK